MDKHEISNLLDDRQRVGQPAGPKGLPECVNFIFQFTGNHNGSAFLRLSYVRKL